MAGLYITFLFATTGNTESSTDQCPPDNYRANGSCSECPPGKFGFNCSMPCEPKYYGRSCRSTCSCLPELCDPKIGCIDTSTGVSSSTQSDATLIPSVATLTPSEETYTPDGNTSQRAQWIVLSGLILVFLIILSCCVIFRKRRERAGMTSMQRNNTPDPERNPIPDDPPLVYEVVPSGNMLYMEVVSVDDPYGARAESEYNVSSYTRERLQRGTCEITSGSVYGCSSDLKGCSGDSENYSIEDESSLYTNDTFTQHPLPEQIGGSIYENSQDIMMANAKTDAAEILND